MARLVSGKQIDHNTLEVGSRVELLGGIVVEVQEQKACKGCFFYSDDGYATGSCEIRFSDGEVCGYCALRSRSDHKSVVFKEV